MRWEVLYNNKEIYISENSKWEELPVDGVIIIWIIFPNGSRMQISGWDNYVVEKDRGGLKVTFWKDKDAIDINGNPMFDEYAGMGGHRTFFPDNIGTNIFYLLNKELHLEQFEKEQIKLGRWVPAEIAEEMGI